MTPVEIAKAQILAARAYTRTLLEGLEPDDWFQMPQGISHIAWQCGHLTMAEYALTMVRVRGKEQRDQEVISSEFFKTFKKGTRPVADAGAYPPLPEILATMQQVHERAMQEIDGYGAELLDEPLPEPYAVEPTKRGSLYFCGAHEMLHAGQIGLLRRLLGKPPMTPPSR